MAHRLALDAPASVTALPCSTSCRRCTCSRTSTGRWPRATSTGSSSPATTACPRRSCVPLRMPGSPVASPGERCGPTPSTQDGLRRVPCGASTTRPLPHPVPTTALLRRSTSTMTAPIGTPGVPSRCRCSPSGATAATWAATSTCSTSGAVHRPGRRRIRHRPSDRGRPLPRRGGAERDRRRLWEFLDRADAAR